MVWYNVGIMGHETLEEQEVLTLAEAAKLLKLHRETLRRLATYGEVPARKVGGVWRFIRSELLDRVSGTRE